MKKIILILFFPILLFAKFQVTTTFPLETYLVKQIGQKNIRIKEINRSFDIKNKLDEQKLDKFSHTWVYFHFGLDYEKNYAQKLLKENNELLLVDMSEGIKKNIFNGKVNHFVWTDPVLMRKVILNIHKTFVKLDKFHKESYDKNLNIFLKKLDDIFWRIKTKLDKSTIFDILVFDEDWYYFAQRFRLNLYRYKKEDVRLKKIKNIREFVLKNGVKIMLINSRASYSLAKLLIINTDIKINIHNIFDKKYFENLIKLSNTLS